MSCTKKIRVCFVSVLLLFLATPLIIAFYDPAEDAILHQQDFETDGVPGAGFNGSKGLVNNSAYNVFFREKLSHPYKL